MGHGRKFWGVLNLTMQSFTWKLQSTPFLYKVVWNVVSDFLTCKNKSFQQFFLQKRISYVIRELYIRGRGRLRQRHLILSFLAYSPKIDILESFILPFFTTKVSTVISVEGGEVLSRLLNDKISNI